MYTVQLTRKCRLKWHSFCNSFSVQFRRKFLGFNNEYWKEQNYVLKRTFNSPVENVYDTISDIQKYKDFVPYCIESYVSQTDSINRPLEAGMRVKYSHYDEKFSCKVRCIEHVDKCKTVVAESATHHLFHFLQTTWNIRPHNKLRDMSEVELSLRFKFKSILYQSVSSVFGKTLTDLVMAVFQKRAYQLRKQKMKGRDMP